MDSPEADLRAHGINEAQGAELRCALATFEDWNTPEMDAYDDYDATKFPSEELRGKIKA